MKKKFGKMKKVSSQTKLSKMNLSDLHDETQAEVSEDMIGKNLLIYSNNFRILSHIYL